MSGTAVVCGAAGGIGSAICGTFRAAGWRVVGIDLRPAEAADLSVAADLRSPEAVQAVFAELETDPIDALVNAAGTQIVRSLAETTPAEWDEVMNVNVRAAFLTMVAARPLLARRGGAVVNIASVHADATSPGMAAYAASKAALVGLTRGAALDLAADGIRVNAVLPGAVDTPMLDEGLRQRSGSGASVDARDSLAARTPLGRIAAPSEVADAVVFLAGDRSRFISGQTLVVDGGVTARLATE
jgi:NAD(P)-dependent dehydrogenase (short-subunit alcohol dehydrogenase family)